MKRELIIVGTAVMLMLSGCTQSHIVTGGDADPIFETQQGIVLDWGQIGEGLDDEFTNTEEYPMGASISYDVDSDKHIIDLTLMVKQGSTPLEAVEYANAVIRGLNDEAATQDFSFAPSTEDSYGGFFDLYTVNLVVMPDGTMNNKNHWLVSMTIPAGSNEKIVAIEGAKAMETTAAEEEEDSE